MEAHRSLTVAALTVLAAAAPAQAEPTTQEGAPAPLATVAPKAKDRVQAATGLRFAVFESKLRRNIISTDTPYGFKVKRVADDSPADRAGIARGWLLMKWAGHPVYQVDELDSWLWELPAGAEVEVEYTRRKKVSILSRKPWEDGKVTVKIGRVHPLRAVLGLNVFDGPDAKVPEDSPAGVRIAACVPRSVAAKSGVESGDVITHWNGVAVRTLAELRDPFLGSLREDPFEVRVLRHDTDGEWRPRALRVAPPAPRKESR